MKKIYSPILALTAIIGLSVPANAQQLPNADFEGSWSTCTPWTNGNGNKTIGENPADWCISHVMGITSGLLAGTGKKAMGEKAEGYNSASAVKIFNESTGAMGITRNVPGYLTVGTTWSTAEGTKTATHDGGTWGGIEFTSRPDALGFMYKREYADANATTEPCSFIAYLWKGTWSQESVPVTITSSGAAKTCTMTNRDRNILNMSCTTGGNVTSAGDAELIAKLIVTQAGAHNDWTYAELPFEYSSASTPSMMNVIFSANNYFDTAAPTIGNSLTIDDVKLLYYSRLASLSINGTAVDGFNADKYSYDIDTELPSTDAITYTLLGNSGSATVSVNLDTENATAAITVTNAQGADADGNSSHTYTLHFKKAEVPEPQPAGDPRYFPGSLTITLGESTIEDNATVEITPMDNDTYKLVLPNFAITIDESPVPLGDIVVKNVTATTNGNTISYTGSVNHFELLGGEIVANIELEGTEVDGVLSLLIHVNWIDPDTDEILAPIEVVFNGKDSSIVEPEPQPAGDPQYYPGSLTITLGESTIEDNATVEITPMDNDTYKIVLPNFAITIDESPIPLGDIVVKNVTATTDGNTISYTGSVNHFELLDGEIVANIELEGTEVNGVLSLLIHVNWIDPDTEEVLAPIEVVFNGKNTAGISGITTDSENAPVEYYDIRGIRVDGTNLTPGYYIRRQGSEVTKILIRR